MKPKTRKERLEWLRLKKGMDYVMSMYALTDREVKEWFERVYPLYKDAPEHESKFQHPECLVCGNEVRIIWDCMCGENNAIIDEDDPELKQRKLEFESR